MTTPNSMYSMKPSLLFVINCRARGQNRLLVCLTSATKCTAPRRGKGTHMAAVEYHRREIHRDVSPGHGHRNGTQNLASYRVTPGAMFAQSQTNNTDLREAPQRSRKAPPWSSPEKKKANNSLSPVEGACAATAGLSSIASASNCQHRLRADPTSELLVHKRILHRECLLSRLEAVCAELRKTSRRPLTSGGFSAATAFLENGTEDVVNMLSSMREATVAVVEAVAVWRERIVDRHPPTAFIWHGENYLLKATNDLNFLAGVEPLVNALRIHPARLCRNPLMLPRTLDEQRRDGKMCNTQDVPNFSKSRNRRHLHRIARVLLDEEDLEVERESLRQITYDSVQPGAPHGVFTSRSNRDRPGSDGGPLEGKVCFFESVHEPTNCSITSDLTYGDEEAIRRQEQLSTWFEEARLQLVALSTSPADEEYFLSSRRFWTREELDLVENGGSFSGQTSPVRRRPKAVSGWKNSTRIYSSGVPLLHSNSIPTLDSRTILRGTKSGRISTPERGGRISFEDSGTSYPPVHYLDPPSHSRHVQGLRSDVRHTDSRGNDKAENRNCGDGRSCSTRRTVQPGRKMGSKGQQRLSFTLHSSAALACITVDDIERLLQDDKPLDATTVVCAIVMSLIAPNHRVPEIVRWPPGFKAMAHDAGAFLTRLHDMSGRVVSPFKAQALRFVLQREDILPMVIEKQGGHTVASLSAWAFEQLRNLREFAEWSNAALKPWYELQLSRADTPDFAVPETAEGPGSGARQVHKSLHALSHGGGSYVLTLFEEGRTASDGLDGLAIRAFDRATRETFWLRLSRKEVVSLGGNVVGRSPADIVVALARRLRIEADGATKVNRLILPPVKNGECNNNRGSGRHCRESHAKSTRKRPRPNDKHKGKTTTFPKPNHANQEASAEELPGYFVSAGELKESSSEGLNVGIETEAASSIEQGQEDNQSLYQRNFDDHGESSGEGAIHGPKSSTKNFKEVDKVENALLSSTNGAILEQETCVRGSLPVTTSGNVRNIGGSPGDSRTESPVDYDRIGAVYEKVECGDENAPADSSQQEGAVGMEPSNWSNTDAGVRSPTGKLVSSNQEKDIGKGYLLLEGPTIHVPLNQAENAVVEAANGENEEITMENDDDYGDKCGQEEQVTGRVETTITVGSTYERQEQESPGAGGSGAGARQGTRESSGRASIDSVPSIFPAGTNTTIDGGSYGCEDSNTPQNGAELSSPQGTVGIGPSGNAATEGSNSMEDFSPDLNNEALARKESDAESVFASDFEANEGDSIALSIPEVQTAEQIQYAVKEWVDGASRESEKNTGVDNVGDVVRNKQTLPETAVPEDLQYVGTPFPGNSIAVATAVKAGKRRKRSSEITPASRRSSSMEDPGSWDIDEIQVASLSPAGKEVLQVNQGEDKQRDETRIKWSDDKDSPPVTAEDDFDIDLEDSD